MCLCVSLWFLLCQRVWAGARWHPSIFGRLGQKAWPRFTSSAPTSFCWSFNTWFRNYPWNYHPAPDSFYFNFQSGFYFSSSSKLKAIHASVCLSSPLAILLTIEIGVFLLLKPLEGAIQLFISNSIAWGDFVLGENMNLFRLIWGSVWLEGALHGVYGHVL